MTNCCISVSNEQDQFPLNELNLGEIGSKMLNYTLNNSQIMNLSALNEYDLSNITLSADVWFAMMMGSEN